MSRRAVGAGIIAAILIACTEPGLDVAGGMLRDAGQVMASAGGSLARAGDRSSGSGGVGGRFLTEAGKMFTDAGRALVDAGGAVAGRSGAAAGSEAQAQEPSDALPRPHWVLRDKDGTPVKAEVHPGYEANGLSFTTKSPDCVYVTYLSNRRIGITYKLASGKIEGCGYQALKNWHESPYYYADAACTGPAYATYQPIYVRIAEGYYYADGQPVEPKPTSIYQWNVSNSTCSKLDDSFAKAVSWWSFKPMPNDVVSLLPLAPYTMELVY